MGSRELPVHVSVQSPSPRPPGQIVPTSRASFPVCSQHSRTPIHSLVPEAGAEVHKGFFMNELGNAYAPTEDRHVRAVMFSSSPKAGICTHCSVLLLFLFLMLLNKSTQWLSGMTHTEQNEDDAPRRETTESYTTVRTFEPTSQALCSPVFTWGAVGGSALGGLTKKGIRPLCQSLRTILPTVCKSGSPP